MGHVCYYCSEVAVAAWLHYALTPVCQWKDFMPFPRCTQATYPAFGGGNENLPYREMANNRKHSEYEHIGSILMPGTLLMF